MNTKTAIDEMIEAAKTQGLQVIAPEKLTTYFWITDGTRLGYCQVDRLRGLTFSTVHKPCKHAGTGYEAASMVNALENRPRWASGDAPVVKWNGPAEFIAKHWQPLIQY